MSPFSLAALAFGLALPPARAEPCRPADAMSEAMVREISARAPVLRIRPIDAADSIRPLRFEGSSVRRETDLSVCRRAAETYRATLEHTGSNFSGRVHVLHVGPLFAVLDPSYYGPEPGAWAIILMDHSYRVVGRL